MKKEDRESKLHSIIVTIGFSIVGLALIGLAFFVYLSRFAGENADISKILSKENIAVTIVILVVASAIGLRKK